MSRSDILQSIRTNRPHFNISSKDFIEEQLISNGDVKETFKKSLKQVGADVIEFNKNDFEEFLIKNGSNVLDFSKQVIKNEYSNSCSLDQLDKIETALLTGKLAVAENGAIWIEDNDLSHRLIPFITQKLILTINNSQIVKNMQEAYQQIQIKDTGFGVFISGPSKTADIEQSLVYGAHGAKELTVIIIGS